MNVYVRELTRYLGQAGVHVDVLQNEACIRLMREFIAAKPQLWNEDIGI